MCMGAMETYNREQQIACGSRRGEGSQGKLPEGEPFFMDFNDVSHVLIGGTTGSGKSTCLHSVIMSILCGATPDEIEFIMIDTRQIELTIYNEIPHLIVPVISDPRKASGAIAWLSTKANERNRLFCEYNVRNINEYNAIFKDQIDKKMKRIFVFIDGLYDVMSIKDNGASIFLNELIQIARATGIYLIITTQSMSRKIITDDIQSNFSTRISFAMPSYSDSRLILGINGAERLRGDGDFFYKSSENNDLIRVQGSYVSIEEIKRIVDFIKAQNKTCYSDKACEKIHILSASHNYQGDALDSIIRKNVEEMKKELIKAIEIVVEARSASTTLLQRKLKLGYTHTARIVDELEEMGIIGPYEGDKPRKVLITKQQWLDFKNSIN